MPCTAKKFEARRPEMNSSGYRDVDYVVTTRELARIIKQSGIRFEELEESKPDPVLSAYTGAATIFGASGGVMEAALRTAYELATGKALAGLDFAEVRGLGGLKEATVDVEGTEIRVAVVSGLSNARRLLESENLRRYHFVEIMACRGGCIGGGGQPLENTMRKREERLRGLYREDAMLPIRKSHENPEVRAIYAEFLGTPGGEKSHHLLHTEYVRRNPVVPDTIGFRKDPGA